MGVSDESAILSKWLMREGDHVRRGQPVFSLETDKATFQYEAESDGFLARILTGEGEEVAVGSPIGVMSDTAVFEESELETLLRELKTPDEKEQAQTKADAPCDDRAASESERVSVQDAPDGKRKISPRARKTADELGVNLETICSGSGPDGRILERDVLSSIQHIAGKPERITCSIWPGRPLTVENRIGMRPVCAEGAGQTGFVCRPVDARKILAQCTLQNGLKPGMVICHQLARLLARMHELNARRHGDRIYEYDTVHLRLTVETSFGTIRPVVRCAESYTLNELAVLMENASNRCKRFSSKPQEFQEGTFTVADLSEYGADCFMPELTPPELCALGIGAVAMQARQNERGGVEAYPVIRLTLAYDRAGVDAIRAAKFLNEFAHLLEPGGTKQ
jgi:pyruvate dehydrogenase E2 component (dihydrolipoamide acetyltransferase)